MRISAGTPPQGIHAGRIVRRDAYAEIYERFLRFVRIIIVGILRAEELRRKTRYTCSEQNQGKIVFKLARSHRSPRRRCSMARWGAPTNGLEVLLCLSVRESCNGIELYESAV